MDCNYSLEITVNHGMGLHTLALLDLDPTGAGTGEQRPMQPKDAVESLKAMAEKLVETVDLVDSVFEQLKVESLAKYVLIFLNESIAMQ